ncbi:MAG: MFS transporter [Planctomycetota bacterium]
MNLPAAAPPRRSAAVRLSFMMFLQYAVWGVWLPILGNYLGSTTDAGGLGFSQGQIGWILGLAGAIGAVASPFIAGQIADRILNAERALALLLLAGGVVKYITAYQTGYFSWMALSILYSVLYMPTLALTNSVAFANLNDPEKKFPPVRAVGTVGWIVASIAFPFIWMKTGVAVDFSAGWPFLRGDEHPDSTARIADALRVSGVVSVGYAAYCLLALPKTPPKGDAAEPLAFAEAFGLFRRPDFAVLTVSALFISMIHNCYFIRTGLYLQEAIGTGASDVGPIMAIGQISEIVVLAVLGLFLKNLGYKLVITLGTLSYAIRYAIFAVEPGVGAVQAAMLLHGLNYGFFFAGSFLFLEKIAPADIRHSAQAVFGLIILGVGPVLSGFYNQYFDRFKVPALDEAGLTVFDEAGKQVMQQQYHQFWWAQSAVAAGVLLLLLVAFRGRVKIADD